MNCNTAIFYDLENITGLSGKDSEAILSKIREAVEQRVGQGKISIQRAYADWNRFQSKELANSMLIWGVSPIHVFNTNSCDKLKNASDVCLIIDALDILYSKPYIDNFVIISGDGIFTLLINKLHEHGKRVIGVGHPLTSNSLFVKSCDEFVDLGSFDTVTDIVETKESLLQKRSTHKLPPNFPNNQLSINLLNSALIPISATESDDSDILNAIKTMTKVIFTYKDTINLSLYNFYLNHFIQKFKPLRFGMKNLKDFVSIVLQGSPYCLYTSEGVIVLTKRELAIMPNKIIQPVQSIQFKLPCGSIKDSLFDIDDGATFVIVKAVAEPKTVSNHKQNKHHKNGKKQLAKQKWVKEEPSEAIDTVSNPENTLIPEVVEDTLTEQAPDRKSTLEEIEMNIDGESPRVVFEDNKLIKNVLSVRAVPDISMTDVIEQIELFGGGGNNIDTSEKLENIPIKKLAKLIFDKLISNELLTKDEISNLTNSEYCKKNFALKYPVLKKIDESIDIRSQRIENGKPLYWLHSLSLDGNRYYLFKEWYGKKQEAKLVDWYYLIKFNRENEEVKSEQPE